MRGESRGFMKASLVKEKRLILIEKLLVLVAFNVETLLEQLKPHLPPDERLQKVIDQQKQTLNELMALADKE